MLSVTKRAINSPKNNTPNIIAYQSVIGVSNIKTCILRYAILFNWSGKTFAKQMLGMGIASI
jgi:hypothetical protein